MKPVRLTFAGLRSYRSETTIDFSDLNLFAVIGDTGAGKSTVIEALCLALYARKSWTGGEAGLADMITDGVNTMRIELTFTAGGHEWTVMRARHRNSSAPIDRLTSSTGGTGADGSKAVTRRVAELIGLDYDQFIRAVVLPQGRFDALLRATEKERNQILTSILDLGDVVATRARAESLRNEWSSRVAAWSAERGVLSASPADDLEAAERRLVDAAELDRRLGAAVDEVARLGAVLGDSTGHRRKLRRALDAASPIPAECAADLVASKEQWVQLDRLAAEVEAKRAAALDGLATLDQRASIVLAGAADRDALVAARATIRRSVDELPEAVAAAAASANRLEALRADPPPTGSTAVLEQAADRAATAVAEADETRRVAERRVTEARGAWQAIQAADARVEAADGAVTDLTRRLAKGADMSAASDVELADARAAVAAAQRAEHEAMLTDAAATAGGECGPGEACPVCRRALPDDFVAPEPSADVAEARVALLAAREAVEARRAEAKRIGDQLAKLEAELPLRTEELAAAQRDAAAAVSEATAAGVEPAAEDEPAALSGVAAALAAADLALLTAREADRVASQALAHAVAFAAAASETYDKELRSIEETVVRTTSDVERLRAPLARLPGQWAINVESLSSADVSGAATALLRSVDSALAELQSIDREREELREARHRSERESDELSRRLREEVQAPVERRLAAINLAVSAASDLHHVASAAASSVVDLPGDPWDPTLPAGVVAPGEVHDAEALAAAVDAIDPLASEIGRVISNASSLLDALDARSEEADAALSSLLAEVGCESADQLHERRGEARRDLGFAHQEVESARDAAARAAGLDSRLAVGAPFVANVSTLAVALRDQHFIAHLVDAREQELLAEASRRLKDITGGRFGFVADFGVVDVGSGEVRSPDTLSGGERFQAALALALGLVEIASRGSGTLDAVFVDEGFGSLDGNALDDALATLGKVAGGGKMVALISHLRHVAESVDTVLLVTKDDVMGSRIDLLDVDEREALLADDLRSGLTS